MKKFFYLSFFSYFIFFLLYSLFSFSLTAPNLIFSSNHYFWQFQTFMWQTFFNNRPLLATTYLSLILFLIINYLLIIFLATKINFKIKLWHLLFLILPLIFANNALSYDVFNYIFNAKMLWLYHANPHVKVALDFAYDDWTRFMHNTHTPAPYGYGWTVFSVLPYALSFNKFLLAFLNFRLLSVLSLSLLFLIFTKLFKTKNNLNLLFLNPLLLIEVVSNSHNDLWMMLPALLAFYLLTKKITYPKLFLSLILIIFSISIKFATLILLPIFIIFALKKNNRPIFYLLASMALFITLLSSRSQQFHPWYLIWSLSFLPLLAKNRIAFHWRNWLIILSIASLFRYLPYLWAGEYTDLVLQQQKLITWSAVLLFAVCFFSPRIGQLIYGKKKSLLSS